MKLMYKGIPTIIFATGATSREVFHIIDDINSTNYQPVYDVIGFICEKKEDIGKKIVKDYESICCDKNFEYMASSYPMLAVAISIGSPMAKERIFNDIHSIPNLIYPNFISPKAIIKQGVKMGKGNVIMENAVLGIDCEIGDFNLINTSSALGHDLKMESFNVVNPLSSISGNVNMGSCNLIGTGANILQNLEIGDNNTIGAGSVVTVNISNNLTIKGVPAK